MGLIYVEQYAEDITSMTPDAIRNLSGSDKRGLLMSLFASDETFEMKDGTRKAFYEWFAKKYKTIILDGKKTFKKSISAKSGGFVLGVVMSARNQSRFNELCNQFSSNSRWGEWKNCEGGVPTRMFSQGDCGEKMFCEAFLPLYIIRSTKKRIITPLFVVTCRSLNINTDVGGEETIRGMWYDHFIYKGWLRRVADTDLRGVAPIGSVEKVLLDFKNDLKPPPPPPPPEEEDGGGGNGGEEEGSYHAGFALPDFITKNQKWLMIGAIGLAIYFLATSKPKK